jgi:hypothetical protein
MNRPTETRRTSIESVRHKDKRANIPTEELRDFVAEDEEHPKTMLYPRDPSLDPYSLSGKAKTSRTRRTWKFRWCPSTFRKRFIPKRSSRTFAAPPRKASLAKPISLPTSTASSLKRWWTSTHSEGPRTDRVLAWVGISVREIIFLTTILRYPYNSLDSFLDRSQYWLRGKWSGC